MFVCSRKIRDAAGRFAPDGFVLAIILVILLAWMLPEYGAIKGFFSLQTLASVGISAVFLFYGIALSPEKLKTGLSLWKLHLLVQLVTFAVFPLLVWAGSCCWMNEGDSLVWIGVFYLSALPSTVSSSVVMVSIARGNVAAAIFNAGISGLIGIILTPLWMGFFLHQKDVPAFSSELWHVFVKLALAVLLPVIAGLLLHKRFVAIVHRHRNHLRHFDQSVILLVVYVSFCESFLSGAFSELRLSSLVILAAALFGLFWLVYGIIHLLCRALGFNRADRITALYCGSKKSLVHGAAMSKVLLHGVTGIGVILLPLMIYHAMQIFIIGFLAGREMKKNAEEKTQP